MSHKSLVMAVACFAIADWATLAHGQDPLFQGQGEITVTQHKMEMKAGDLYVVRVLGKGFMPNAHVQPGFLRQRFIAQNFNQPFAGKALTYEATFSPQQSQEHIITVLPIAFGTLPEGPLQYELTVKRLRFSDKPLLDKKDELTADDPVLNVANVFGKKKHKSYAVTLQAGRTYAIEMTRNRNESKLRDPYLILLDSGKKMVSQDDDGAGDLNSRIIFDPPKEGEYHIIATSLTGNDAGAFTLTVREAVKE
jgi:hypothetical protein